MVKNLELSDFRAVRRVLEPDDFALTDGKPDPPPSDLIGEKAWDHIMTLPGDVAIRTSGYQGSRISLLNDLTAEWIGSLQETGIATWAMLEVIGNLESSIFFQLHGFYRESISTLRNALEISVMATQCVLGKNEDMWNKWEEGDEEIKFGATCDELATFPLIKIREQDVINTCGTGLFMKSDPLGHKSWSRALYRKVCRFSHARGDTTNGALWSSNGPIYSANGFKASYHTFLEVHALCLILSKVIVPKLPLTKAAKLVFRSESVKDYLDEPYRSICTAYKSILW